MQNNQTISSLYSSKVGYKYIPLTLKHVILVTTMTLIQCENYIGPKVFPHRKSKFIKENLITIKWKVWKSQSAVDCILKCCS